MATYKVKAGDTLGQIAAKYKTTVSELMALNSGLIKDKNLIRVGWEITLPGSSDSGDQGKASSTNSNEGQSLNNVPGTPQVWKVGNSSFLVYTVPGTDDDPVYIAWEVPSQKDLQSFFGPDQKIVYNRQITAAAFKGLGVLEFGTTDEIPASEKDPFNTWTNEMTMQSQTQPWILDDDYQALAAMAMIEGRQLTDSEIATTQWWKDHNKAQREWMRLYHGDPSEAQRILGDRELQVANQIKASGGGTADPALVRAIASQWAHGNWSEGYTIQQIKALVDPHSNIQIDEAIMDVASQNPLNQTTDQEGKVRELLNTWLGPAFGSWSESEISRIAGQLRNNDMTEDDFVETLKDQRMAVLPMYTDRNLSYQAISNTWRQFYIGQWGQNPDETSDLWLKVLKNNDTEESGQLLRREGYNRGVPKVISDLNSQTLQRTGGSEREAIYA